MVIRFNISAYGNIFFSEKSTKPHQSCIKTLSDIADGAFFAKIVNDFQRKDKTRIK